MASRINSGLATAPPLLSDDEAKDVYASLGAVTFEQPDDGFIYVYAYTARGQCVQNVVRDDAPADRVVAAAAMVWRRRAAWDRLQAPFRGIDRSVAPASLQNLPPQRPLSVELAREGIAKALRSWRGGPR